MNGNPILGAVILAGGKRALDEKHNPDLPKMLEDLEGKPVLEHVIEAVRGMKYMSGIDKITVIISSRFEEPLRDFLARYPAINIAVQDGHRGTADAIQQAIEQRRYPDCDHLLVALADQPLIAPEDFDGFYNQFLEDDPIMRAAILAFREQRWKPEFQKCATVLRNGDGAFSELRTRLPVKEGDPAEQLHAGPYFFESRWLRGILRMLKPLVDHHEGEFHLYVPLVAAREDTGVHVCESDHPDRFLGVDTRKALEEVRRRMRIRMTS